MAPVHSGAGGAFSLGYMAYLMQLHRSNVMSGGPQTEKSRLMANNKVKEPMGNTKKKRNRKKKNKANGTEGSVVPKDGANNDVKESKVDATLETGPGKVDQMDSEKRDFDSMEQRAEPIPMDETKRPIQLKRPATENVDLCSQEKKSRLMANNKVKEPMGNTKKKRNRKKKNKANGTEGSVVPKDGANNDVKESKVDATLETGPGKVDQMDSEKRDFDSMEQRAGFSSATDQPFENLRGTVSDVTLEAIEKMGFKTMTKIQAEAIPPALEGKDVRGLAKTGSGKTLAFAIPIVELLSTKFMPSEGTLALVISPTRELSMQIHSVLRKLMEGRPHTMGLIMGGTNRNTEMKSLQKGMSVVVATPGRLLDHMKNSPNVVFKNLKCLVIDEVDRICDRGFEKDLRQILMLLPKSRQTLLFSATIDKKAENLAQLAVKEEPMEIDVDADKRQATTETLKQVYAVCPPEERFKMLYTFLSENRKKKMMVFFSTCKAVKFNYGVLAHFGLPVMHIHGHQKQNLRSVNFNKFSSAETGILLCTDIAARGWDIPDVDLIVQYDPPSDPNEYIHRVGRTARAGGKGGALLFVMATEIGFIPYLKANKVNIDRIEITCKDDNIQLELENLLKKDKEMFALAQKALKSYMRCYFSHKHKQVFNHKLLDVGKIAKNFGLTSVPKFNMKK